MTSANGGLPDGAVHAFDLAIDPGMLGFGEAMVDIVAAESCLESMGAEALSSFPAPFDVWSRRADVASSGEVSAVVGQYGMDFVGNGLDQFVKEVGCGSAGGLSEQSRESELEVRSTATKR